MAPELKLVSRAERTTHTKVDTISFTADEARAWIAPPFQRPLQAPQRVEEIGRQIAADGGVIPGILTLGVLANKTYLVDGQHRREAFLQSQAPAGYADVRWCEFDSLAAMADEFVQLNSQIARFTTDDILRGMEAGSPGVLQRLRRALPWIGYGHIRQGERSPIMSMSSALKCWIGSANEVPVPQITRAALDDKFTTPGKTSLQTAIGHLPEEEVRQMLRCFTICFDAWGRDAVHARLWGTLNLTLVCWLYRRMVISQYSARTIKLSDELFQKCLMSLAADPTYTDYLAGRRLSDRDRPPTYGRIRTIFVRRIEDEAGVKAKFPQPDWVRS